MFNSAITYATLNDALDDIARRSFYEDATITPRDNGTYDVESAPGFVGWDGIDWTYADGFMQLPDGTIDHSRLHDAAETYTQAGHIRYNLEAAVEVLESGAPVTFAYMIASNADAVWDDAEQEYIDADGDTTDEYAGWALVAVKGGWAA